MKSHITQWMVNRDGEAEEIGMYEWKVLRPHFPDDRMGGERINDACTGKMVLSLFVSLVE